MEHTKGNWELGHVSPWEIWVGADIHIADVHGTQEVRQANAHLISAAPNLLKACKEIQEGPDEHCNEIHLTGDYQTGLFCGLKDRDITDRYDACMYGFNKAVERVLEWAQGIVEESITKAKGE